MQKYAALLVTLVLMAFIAGCGGSSNIAATTLPAIIPVGLATTDVSGMTLYSTSINGYIAYQLDDDGTAHWDSAKNNADTPPLGTNGSWSLSADGMLVLTSGTETHQFKRLQTEPSYWLVSDTAHNEAMTRFYFGTTAARTTTRDSARAYLAPITSTSGVVMGGAVQGGTISAKASFANYSVSTFTGTTGTVGLADGTGTAASFNHPTGITTDGTNYYVTDYDNSRIRQIDKNGVVTTLAFTDAGGAVVSFNHPSDITTDGTNLFVVDSFNHCIRRINISTKVTATIGSTSALSGAVDSSTTPADVRFSSPTGITTDGTNLYVTDSGNHTIRKIVISSNAVSTLAGSAGNSGSADGTGSVARFYVPARLTTDGSYLYVTDFNNRTIRKIVISTGAVTTIAGSVGILGSTASAATGADARFNQPNGITTDGTSLYITDSYNNTLSKMAINNNTIFSGQVTMIVSGTSGTPGHVDSVNGTPSFDTPVGITTDGPNLLVVDNRNNTIRKIH